MSTAPKSEGQAGEVIPLAEPAGWALLIAVFGLVLLQVLTVVRYAPPDPKPASAAESEFSAVRAKETLLGLLGDGRPHPVGSEANSRVRDRLTEALDGFGYPWRSEQQAQVSQQYSAWGRVQNVLARLDGQEQGNAILLVAHYDSKGAGAGAGDDGAGVATLLEIARALKASGSQPKRSVIFLFTDGEESGLLGADAFVAHDEWFKDVGVVFNIEARGSRGPSLMFETGPNNAELIARLAAVAPRPVGGSSFSAVYERMPNNTDFTPFRNKDLPGLNFAFIGGTAHYHTARDDLENLSAGSLQHHGDNVLALVRSLAFEAPLTGTVEGDAVYFDVFAFGVVRWPQALATVFGGLALLSVLGTLALLVTRGLISGRALSLGLIAWTGALVLSIVGAGALTSLFAFGGAIPRFPWPAEPGPQIVVTWAAVLSVQSLVSLALSRKIGYWGAWGGTWLGWGLLSLVSSILIPGFSYLFCLPALIAGGAGLVGALTGLSTRKGYAALTGLVPLLVGGALFLPVIHLMYDAVGLGVALKVLSPLACVISIFLTATLPLLFLRDLARHQAVILTALGLLLVAGTAATRAPVYTEDSPRKLTYSFVQDADAGTAQWALYTPDTGLPVYVRALPIAFSSELGSVRPWDGRGTHHTAPARALELPGPELTKLSEDTAEGGARKVRIKLRSRRGALYAGLVVKREDLRSIVVEGQEGQIGSPSSGHTVFWFYGIPLDGVEVELTLTGGPKTEVWVVDVTQGLPSSGRVLVESRPATATSFHRGEETYFFHKQQL